MFYYFEIRLLDQYFMCLQEQYVSKSAVLVSFAQELKYKVLVSGFFTLAFKFDIHYISLDVQYIFESPCE